MFRDWFIFYQAARVASEGSSPYLVVGFYNPIQVAWLLSPTTFVPFQVWAWGLIAVSFLAVLVLCRKRSHWVLLSLPFVLGMTMGTIDLLLWVPARLFGGAGLALLTLKPQLAAVVIPLQVAAWWREKNFMEIGRLAAATGALWGIPCMIRPGWFSEWLAAVPPLESRMDGAATIAGFAVVTEGRWAYVALFGAALLALLIRRSNAYYLLASFAPAFWPSDWIIAAQYVTWRFAALSWLLVPTGIGVNGAQFYFLLGILIWCERNGKIGEWVRRFAGERLGMRRTARLAGEMEEHSG